MDMVVWTIVRDSCVRWALRMGNALVCVHSRRVTTFLAADGESPLDLAFGGCR